MDSQDTSLDMLDEEEVSIVHTICHIQSVDDVGCKNLTRLRSIQSLENFKISCNNNTCTIVTVIYY